MLFKIYIIDCCISLLHSVKKKRKLAVTINMFQGILFGSRRLGAKTLIKLTSVCNTLVQPKQLLSGYNLSNLHSNKFFQKL